MVTYIYAEKNGSASITISADDEEDAGFYLENVVRFPTAWRLDEVREDG